MLRCSISQFTDTGLTQDSFTQRSRDARRVDTRYVSRQLNKSFALAIFERSGLVGLRSEKPKVRQMDELRDRFNVTAG